MRRPQALLSDEFCSEAKQFLRNCPGMEMDGDNDGIPCEQQLCSGPFGGG
ncbi:excalibur calcium-binding domain-containing protein [Hydrogenophaga pseudoflava]|nr:excalibur calcium-binding domain-containing protein [Hydrogenophaga pseudoflava]MDQ7743218.1 excalibur calcium-binding domain-containing protein [Hydrogenophaga pseudoflava]